MNINAILRRAEKTIWQLEHWRASRMVIAHPDLCIFANFMPRWGWRRLVKIGETKGFSMLCLGWLTFSVRW